MSAYRMNHRKPSNYAGHRAKLAKRHGHLIPSPTRTARTAKPHLDRSGLQRERRAVDVFSFAGVVTPEWWRSIRRASEQEDLAGVDAWVETDLGPVAVQVKSSRGGAVAWRAKHPEIDAAVVVLRDEMTDADVRMVVTLSVEMVRERMERRAA